MEVIYIPWSRAIELCYRLATKVLDDNVRPDMVIAISRGGLVPARIVSDVLGVDQLYVVKSRLWGIGGKLYDQPRIEGAQAIEVDGKDVLIIDEVVDTGATMNKVVDIIKWNGAKSVKAGVLHYKSTSSFIPDYFVEKIERWAWIFYPWSFSETLYALASKEGSDILQNAFRILKRVNATELYIDPLSITRSLERYIEEGQGRSR